MGELTDDVQPLDLRHVRFVDSTALERLLVLTGLDRRLEITARPPGVTGP